MSDKLKRKHTKLVEETRILCINHLTNSLIAAADINSDQSGCILHSEIREITKHFDLIKAQLDYVKASDPGY